MMKKKYLPQSVSFFRNIDYTQLDQVYQQFVENNCQHNEKTPAAFHEVMILYPEDEKVNTQEIQELMKDYITRRKADNGIILSYASILPKKKVHIDFLISGNEINSSQSIQDSKLFQQAIKKYLIQRYPHLAKKAKTKQVAPPLTPAQQKLAEKIKLRKAVLAYVTQAFFQLLEKSKNMAELVEKVTQHPKMNFYTQDGKVAGITYKGKKYRLMTLGLCTNKTKTTPSRFSEDDGNGKGRNKTNRKNPRKTLLLNILLKSNFPLFLFLKLFYRKNTCIFEYG